jgi:rfaE bifunctional protein kinase chain/domain
MTPQRFSQITRKFPALCVAVFGDFCLDRYLILDPRQRERSIETGRAVHNVIKIRPQAGGAGTALQNVVALGAKQIFAVGFSGEDAEGFELDRVLSAFPRTDLRFWTKTSARRTFTYTKPLLKNRELNRLDFKNWTPTPPDLQQKVAKSLRKIVKKVDALIVVEQVDAPETGLVTAKIKKVLAKFPRKIIVCDSRARVSDYKNVIVKTNSAQLSRVEAAKLARRNRKPVFLTESARGISVFTPDGKKFRVGAHKIRGKIDVVGAGDAVLAAVAMSLAAGASPLEAAELGNAAGAVVVKKIGTTGAASVAELRRVLFQSR